MSFAPANRIKVLNSAPINHRGGYVLYWMLADRRLSYSFGLDRAVGLARELSKPLLILETISVDYPWSSPRHHRFVFEGMLDHHQASAKLDLSYYPYVESVAGQVKDLVVSLANRSCVVISDDFPSRHHRRLTGTVAAATNVCMEAVDSNGLLPMRLTERLFPSAHSFRRHVQRELPKQFLLAPSASPFSRLPGELRRVIVHKDIIRRFPPAKTEVLTSDPAFIASLALKTSTAPAPVEGGSRAAKKKLETFVEKKLSRYHIDRNEPALDATSGLSPYLHHGHISTHEILEAIRQAEDWSPENVALKPTGSKFGWWGMSESGEAFLDELITWRELGYNMSANSDEYDQYGSLPFWAMQTLKQHARDLRPYSYARDQLESGVTHDTLWNAAQTQLVREGRIHNYLRMLWGKKILEWTRFPEEALEIMIELNDKYALDGCNPNSYSGIFWVLGRYDRPWGPERPVFGKVRYMSSENTARKFKVKEYLVRYLK